MSQQTNQSPPRMARALGFSLVELLIGMVVGLLLLLGIVQIFVGNKASFEAQESQAALQENARVSSFLLDLTIGHAGFRPNAFEDESEALSGDGITGVEGNPDEVTVRFLSDGNLIDCFGATLANGDESINRFFLGPADADGLRDLRCTRTQIPSGGGANVTSTAAIIENVETMEILYGVDTDGDISVDRYMNATDAAAQGFDSVLSVRLAIVLVTDDNTRLAGGTQTLSVLGTDQTFGAADDRRQREVIEHVIALRNRLL